MEIASVKEALNLHDRYKAITPYTLGLCIKDFVNKGVVGELSSLRTSAKGNLVAAINEVKADTANLKEFISSQKLLATPGWYMNANQNVTLSEKISEQKNGIVLIFSVITDNVLEDSGFNSFFIPKQAVATHLGGGHSFFLTAWGGMSIVGHKYLYINDTTITGHANNTKTGDAQGITLSSNRFVLRYVIGV